MISTTGQPRADPPLGGAGAAASPLLEVRNLRLDLPIDRELKRVLHDVSLQILPGEAVGLVGESGSGKSLTARSIARLLPRGAVMSGEILFDGRSVMDLRGSALRRHRARAVSMIFQDPRAHTNPVRSIGDFLTEALCKEMGVSSSDARRRAVQSLADVGIADGERRLRQYPHELSGGLLQRAMIAAALLAEPRLILADEPTTALDVTTQSEVMAILDDLRRERRLSLLFITHDLELAAAVCDRTAVMYAGSIVELRTSAALHNDPLHPYSAALMAARPSINVTSRRLPAIWGDRSRRSRRLLDARSLDAAPTTSSAAWIRRRRSVRCKAVWCAAAAPRSCEGDCLSGQSRRRGRVSEQVIVAEGLRKVFTARGAAADENEIVAVDDVSFTVANGSSLAIVGESGSGKTTVARMLVGLEHPTAGRIVIAGHERTKPSKRSAERKARGGEIQIVFQDPYSSLDPRQTAAESLEEALKLHFSLSKSERAERVHHLADQVGLDERQVRARPRGLSGGQRQRVAIARALAAEPRALVLDESVASLDVSIQAQILNLLADIREQTGISYVFISHDLAVVRQVTDKALVMQRGRAVEYGPTEQILDHPNHPYTRVLRSSVPGRGWKPSRQSQPV